MIRCIILCLLLATAACANGHEAPVAQGALFQLNPDKWSFNTNDITTVPHP